MGLDNNKDKTLQKSEELAKEQKNEFKVDTKRRMSWIRYTILISAFVIFNLGLWGVAVLPFFFPVMLCQDLDTKTILCAFAAFQRALTFKWGVALYFSFAALGTILSVVILFGRFSCAWICPGALIQEILTGIRSFFNIKSREFPWKVHAILREVKYALLFIVILLSVGAGLIRMADVAVSNAYRNQIPGEFALEPVCNICISPNLLINSAGFIANMGTGHFPVLGIEFFAVFFILLVLIGAFFINNFYCRYLCAWGAFMGWFNKVSGLKIVRNDDKCPPDCKHCENGCPMKVDSLISKEPCERVSDPECNMCLDCVSFCPENAIDVKFLNKEISRESLGNLFKKIFNKNEGGRKDESYKV